MAHPSEADVLTAVALAAKRHWGYPETWIAHWRPILTVTPSFITAHETFVAREAERVLGFAALSRDGKRLFLEDLWVLPGEMDQRVGRALFRHAQRRARLLGFKSFDIEAHPRAADFYEEMGAKRIGTNTAIVEGQRRSLPLYRCDTLHIVDGETSPDFGG